MPVENTPPALPPTHRCPPEGSSIMPCCGRTPFERRGDRITVDPKQVTCGKPALYPTKTRLMLARDIQCAFIRHWHFIKPESRCDVTDRLVTARVAELVAAGLAVLGEPSGVNVSIVALTPAGEEWLQTYGGTE